jgi:photosystem II stability/assembly factor-like uncharacterized protein
VNNALRKFSAELALLFWLPVSSAFGGWQAQPFPFSERLHIVRFANSQVGWIAGEKYLYKTLDGGASWVKQDSAWGYCETLCVLDENTVFWSDCSLESWMHTRGIRKTSDGGQSWVTVDTSQYFYSDMEFVTAKIGFAAGIGPQGALIRKTMDGGDHWVTLPATFKITKDEIQGISFINEQQGWAISYDGYIFKTENSGLSWALLDSIRDEYNKSVPMRDIQFVTPDSGWAVGGISGGMVIARSVDGGKKWGVSITGGTSLQEVRFLSSTAGWVAGMSNVQPYLASTVDGGVKWNTDSDGIEYLAGINISGVQSISILADNLGYAIARFGHNSYCLLKLDEPSSIQSCAQHLRIPDGFSLEQNYPNPFNAESVIAFDLPSQTHVALTLYNVRGEMICTLCDKSLPAGRHELKLTAGMLPSGLYFYRMTAGKFAAARKFVVAR